MARAGVTREQIFETAEALVREGQSPTVVAVRTRLGGGSPNTIAPLLSEWRALNDSRQAAGLPSVPEPVEAVLRQVWGVAWKEAQGQLATERAALGKLREESGCRVSARDTCRGLLLPTGLAQWRQLILCRGRPAVAAALHTAERHSAHK